MAELVCNAAARRGLIAIAAGVRRVSGDPAAGQDVVKRPTVHGGVLAGPPSEMGRPHPDRGRRLRSSVSDGRIVVVRHEDSFTPPSPMIDVHVPSGRRDLAKLFLRSGPLP